MNDIDPGFCPICQSPNACAMEKARATGLALEPCWCVDAEFAPEVLALLPTAARGKACICAKCASQSKDVLSLNL
ncbi:cysteine-rich CWC family protein [Limnohabitans sp.]|uniref:cysteine-rich CWC family protein n=1 Tax=Limnohabitans sp. TaxID=1907725 RepID=UPI0033413266